MAARTFSEVYAGRRRGWRTGEPWAEELRDRWRLAVENYCTRYGVMVRRGESDSFSDSHH
jgi:hypothetical protein